MSITAAKRKENEKKERGKKSKIEKPKDLGHFLFLAVWRMPVTYELS